MSLDLSLMDYPKDLDLKGGFKCALRPLESADEMAFHEFFLAVPTQERLFIKHRVTDPGIIHQWCQNIDLGRNLPLLAVLDGQIIGDATGIVKLVFRRSDKRLLGAHVIGENAAELIHIASAVLHHGGAIDAFIDMVFNYPTLSDAYKYAAYDGLGRLAGRPGP